jgi:PAS domain S-box-containing protein
MNFHADHAFVKPQGLKPTVLVVDDEPWLRLAISDLIEDTYAVLTGESGEAGLRLLAEHPEVAVIVCDQRMPGMDGDQFLEHARARSEATRVLITGFADLDSVIRAVNRGQIHSYMSKPFERDHLLMVVAAAFRAFQIEAELLEERALLGALMDNMPDLITFRDADGRFVRVNRAKADHLGVDDPRMAVGRAESDFYPVDQAAEIVAAEHSLAIEAARPISLEWRLVHDDEEQWWSTIAAPIEAPLRGCQRTVAISRDITARMATLQKLKTSLKMDASGNLTGAIPHDFDNLLAIMIGTLELLPETTQLDAASASLVDDVTIAALRAAELTHRLLAFARRRPLRPTGLDITSRRPRP